MTSILYSLSPELAALLYSVLLILIIVGSFMLEKIMSAFKPKPVSTEVQTQEQKVEDVGNTAEVVEGAVEAVEAVVEDNPTLPPTFTPEQLKDWSERLQSYVYDAELSAELAPVFATLSTVQGFDKVLELLDTKEKQIEAIGSSHNKLQSEPESIVTQAEAKPVSATDILKARYSQNLK